MISKIHKLILGTVQFGIDYGVNNKNGKPSESEVENILLRAYQAGIRCLDTAESYGDAHRIIGDFHRRHTGIRFDIITKVPQNFKGTLSAKIQAYKEELNVDRLKGILFHSYHTYSDKKNELVQLGTLKQTGEIENIGVSVYTNLQIEDVIRDKLVDVVQLPFNLFDNINLRGEVLRKINDEGKTVHARSAFLQGLFFMASDSDHKIAKALGSELDHLRKILTTYNITIQELALNYCLQQPMIHNVLFGIDNLSQLNQNLSDASYTLTSNLISKIEEIRVKNVDMLNPSLWS